MLPLLQYRRRQTLPGRPLRVMLAAPRERCCERLDDFLLISPLFDLVGRADAESRALQLYFRVRPDVTLLDWRVAANEPARFIGLLRRVAPDAYIISIVPSLDSMPARAASALGADVVVTCDMLPAALAALAGATDDTASAESGQCA
ncbi:two-component system response regulator [Aromatoleum anaerobium]|uniref:Two-component system response regulator n=1 Tax=Aromatoleum anaerobium TaxID=182180 RepID=A0ABX1PTB1_9RHOO|nr:two-component system response regulator [Aromatoleum anaerobium]MCK0506722.1 two-component system response regulator [Aromatoleum anaerobium]